MTHKYYYRLTHWPIYVRIGDDAYNPEYGPDVRLSLKNMLPLDIKGVIFLTTYWMKRPQLLKIEALRKTIKDALKELAYE